MAETADNVPGNHRFPKIFIASYPWRQNLYLFLFLRFEG